MMILTCREDKMIMILRISMKKSLRILLKSLIRWKRKRRGSLEVYLVRLRVLVNLLVEDRFPMVIKAYFNQWSFQIRGRGEVVFFKKILVSNSLKLMILMIFSNHKLIRKNKKMSMWKKVQFSSFSGRRDLIARFVLGFSIGLH